MLRIVCVDDEQNILEGLRRSMYGMRAEWKPEYCLSAEQALASLAREPADVVISDMRMPGMDGAQLLGEVKRLYPQTTRIILSGHAERDSIMKVAGTAHQFLSKPCDLAVLKVVITRAQNLGRLIREKQMAIWAGRIDTLPSLPLVYQELVAQLRNPDTTFTHVGRIICRDVAMTATILKLVNSAFFGAPQKIASIERAVAFLGIDTITNLVLVSGVFKECRTIVQPDFSLSRLWQHSLQAATAARALAVHDQWPEHRADEAFLAGLLHDVGKIVLATQSELPAVEGAAAVDHAQVGAYLLGTWGFSDSLVEAIAFHHEPGKAADGGLALAGLVHVADYLAHLGNGTKPAEGISVDPLFLESPQMRARFEAWRAVWPAATAVESPA